MKYDNCVSSVNEVYNAKIGWSEKGCLKDFKYAIPSHKYTKAYKHYCKKRNRFCYRWWQFWK